LHHSLHRFDEVGPESRRGLLNPGLERTEPNEVRIEKHLADHEAPVRFEDPPQFSQSGVLVRDLTQHPHEVGTVKGAVTVRKLLRIALLRPDVRDSLRARSGHHVIEHRMLDIEDVKRPIGCQRRSHRNRVDPDARPDLEDGSPL